MPCAQWQAMAVSPWRGHHRDAVNRNNEGQQSANWGTKAWLCWVILR